MLFNSVVKAALLATALAQPVQHQHHQHKHEKKDVVTRTVVVTMDADETADAAPAPATNVAAAVAPSAVSFSSYSHSYSYSYSSSSSPAAAPAAPAPVTTTAPPRLPPPPPSKTSTSTSSTATATATGSFAAPVKGITYSPYSADGTCKSASQVKSEVQALSGYEVIRLYGVDCNQVPNVLAGMSSNQKLFAGIYFVDAIEAGVQQLAAAVNAANGWGQVHTVSIGNELVNAGAATVDQISSYVATGRAALRAAGYTGPVVSVDTFIAIYTHKDLCGVSDYIAANAHAYFDGGVAAEDAGTWVAQQIQGLKNTCPGKEVLIVESGWPTQGSENGKAFAGVSQQKAALADIASKAKDQVFYFNAYNDLWKQDGYLNCEKYWGIYSS
ncbi:hypothetical protein JCM33374_g998 [Metschnikowia sp. JCM 33374]|nr:hypothetical protein JCM33374_g998 [Metschnikowia sp. JCM 33374]